MDGYKHGLLFSVLTLASFNLTQRQKQDHGKHTLRPTRHLPEGI